MKAVLKLTLIVLLALIIQVNPAIAQKGHHHGGGGGYKKVYVNKPYNNKVVVVKNYHPHYHHHPHYYRRAYHPFWGPPVGYYRRWVYFPHYNFYWDNYSSMYVYWGPGGWVRAAALPPALININISNEKKYELKEDDDKVDDIYDNNTSHKKEYPEN